MAVKFCPGCHTFSDISPDTTCWEPEEYKAFFVRQYKCPTCEYTVESSGWTDVHEGQPYQDIDEYLMQEDFIYPELGDFYSPDLSVSNNILNIKLYAKNDDDNFFAIAQDISTAIYFYLGRAVVQVFDGIELILDKNITKYIFECTNCRHVHICNLRKAGNCGLVMQCPGCGLIEQINVVEGEYDFSIFLGKDQNFFSLIGEWQDPRWNNPDYC